MSIRILLLDSARDLRNILKQQDIEVVGLPEAVRSSVKSELPGELSGDVLLLGVAVPPESGTETPSGTDLLPEATSTSREPHNSRDAAPNPTCTEPGLTELTARQREVLHLLAEGMSNKEVSRCLSISVKTVEAHRAQIMEKLRIRTVAGLTKFAIRCGLTSLDA